MSLTQMTRKELTSLAKANLKVIAALEKQNAEILRASWILNDKRQQYFEEIVTVGRGKNKRQEKRGIITWKEYFKDEHTGKRIQIQRHMVVRRNGQWINE